MSAAGGPPARAGRGGLVALALVGAVGVAQAVAVLADVGGPPRPALSAAAARGQALWRAHNCQACHQLRGLGGFLGADLTHVAARATADELAPVLADGRGLMPAPHLGRRAQADLFAFWRVCDAEGPGVPPGPRDRRPVPPRDHFERLVDTLAAHLPRPVPDRVRRALALVRRHECGRCHVPLTRGRWGAPDWTIRIVTRPRAALAATLRRGRNAMPGFALSDAEVATLLDAMEWMAGHRDALAAADAELCGREPFTLAAVPWFDGR